MHRYTLERYRGSASRYTCPSCGRKRVFTRYVDTHNNNIYVADNVGKCSRLDKCNYHYTPRQYFDDHPWLRDNARDNTRHPPRPTTSRRTRERPKPQERPVAPYTIPQELLTRTQFHNSPHTLWLARKFGVEAMVRIATMYRIGGCEDWTIFWQIDAQGHLRTGKCMYYDEHTGKRVKEGFSIDWVHAIMRREGALPEGWELRQCLYGEHLLGEHPEATVAIVEAYKTAHVGAILMPDYVWVAVDSLGGLTAERLKPLKGRSVILFPDEGKGYDEWSRRIGTISREVGFTYRISSFMEGRDKGSDIADL